LIGYACISSVGQSLDVQREQLEAAGCDEVFLEKKSGTTTEGRDALAEAIKYARKGDTFIVTRLDRLARSLSDLLSIMAQLKAKGVAFRCTEQTGVDTTGPMGKLMLSVLGAFAEFENGIRKERQIDGIGRAKARGVYKGRPDSIKATDIHALREQGLGATAIAKRLKIARASVYRVGL
jgi:DNA invertase Pin-like site-specific DNA recombinase